MGSGVTFIDEKSRAERTVRLVYPAEADIAEGRMSILTPVGAGLIGLSVGQSINWPDRGGIEHRLTIVAVERSQEHTSELPTLMRTSAAVFCIKKKKNTKT